MPLKAAIVPVTPFMQNCTLLWDDGNMIGAVVDPGGDVRRIQAGIAKAEMSVEKIILTHGHIDHAGGAAELKEKLSATSRLKDRTGPMISCSKGLNNRVWNSACRGCATSSLIAGSLKATR